MHVYFEQFYLGCLANPSYLLASEGEAVVVDPQRDVDLYLNAAADHGFTIRHVFETHLHADFVSGHKELAVHCKSGYRSMIASSLLQRAGFKHLHNVLGGFDAWKAANLPSVTHTAVQA
jgi:rhodanese-related sulfurtransferase